MRILFFTNRQFPSQHAFLEIVYSKNIVKKGYDVYWVMPTREKSEKFISIGRWNKSIVIKCSLPKKKSIISKYIFNVKILFYIILIYKRLNPDIVQTRNWLWGLLISYLIKKVKSVKLVFQYSFPRDLILKKDISTSKNLKVKIRSFLELMWLSNLMKTADIIFPISSAMKDHLIDIGCDNNKLIPIGLAFDNTININDYDNHRIKKLYRIENQHVITYFGKMDEKRELEFLIALFKNFNDVISNSKLFMIGGSQIQNDRLLKESKKLKINNNIIFTGIIPRNEIPLYLKASDITLSPIPPTDYYMLSSVTKVYESLGCGVPVVGTNLPEQKYLIESSNGGIVCGYIKEEFVNAMVYLIENKNKRVKMGEEAKKYVHQNFTYDHRTKMVIDAYKMLT